MQQKWWHDATIYQIYLRSFFDANNDGIGDIKGVISKLDYLEDLGVEVLWISPHYDSPMDDNGYDVRDFYKVSADYGTIEDFKTLLSEARKRNMKIITDLVLNHTSDEHPWFKAAKDPSHPEHEKYKDFYIWQPPKMVDGTREKPTQWKSWFGGPVWEYVEALDEYYLHIFSKKMPDLNWRNETMRAELKTMIQWWVDLGVDGFRVDASNHLEKNWSFPEGDPGQENFSSLPKHHEYLQELGEEIFLPNDLLTIGEAGGASREEALQYAGKDSKEFSLLIQFEHCWADTDDSNHLTPGKWAKGTVDWPAIKKSFAKWIKTYENEGFHTIYWHNHDQPRVVSHYGNDGQHWEKSAKMLAMSLYMLPGIPIIYYGEEIGMTNVDYEHLEQFRDVEVFTEYQNFINNGASHDTAMQALKDRARDNARTPMQWDDTTYGGFTQTQPWIDVNQNKDTINVKAQQTSHSILSTYKALIKARKKDDINRARATFHDLDDPETFVYETHTENNDYLIIANLTENTVTYRNQVPLDDYELWMSNSEPKQDTLEPFDTFIYYKKRT